MFQCPRPIVLVVEDEILIRMLAVDAFLEEGFEVLEAEHVEGALIILATPALVQLLFTDVNMPGSRDGIDLAEQAKANFPALKVIITSALPLVRPVEHLTATFVAKPYDPVAVARTGKSLLAA